LDNLLAILD